MNTNMNDPIDIEHVAQAAKFVFKAAVGEHRLTRFTSH